MVLVLDLLDSSTLPLVYLEVKPCTYVGSTYFRRGSPSFLATAIKVHLLNRACEVQLSLNTTDENEEILATLLQPTDGSQEHTFQRVKLQVNNPGVVGEEKYVFWLPQQNPNLPTRCPCFCFGDVDTTQLKGEAATAAFKVSITEATMVSVSESDSEHMDFATTRGLSSSLPSSSLGLLENQNPAAIQELTLRLRRLVAEPVSIGTAPNDESVGTQQALGSSAQLWHPPNVMEFKRDGALLFHSPEHGAGKTLLVEHLAHKIGCSQVHKVHISPFLSKYGVTADEALESCLHQKVLRAAMEGESICIILDDFSAMLSPSLSGSVGAGDAAAPVLSAVAAYLQLLTFSLYHHKVFPFPTKNRMYNIHGLKCRGFKVPVRLCLVAIATSPDDWWNMRNNSSSANIFNLSKAAKYRLPSLDATTRLKAFQNAIRNEGLSCHPEFEHKLPQLAASALWARGVDFQLLARRIGSQLHPHRRVSEQDFVSALRHVRKSRAVSEARVEFFASDGDDISEAFEAVGGNEDAKIALEEALAIDKKKRAVLEKFGMSPPSGVLLFGPPGTGKTLLAKAVAKLLKSKSVAGGAFVAVSSTDVASAEVGTGEKLLARAFETARSNAPAVIFIDEFQALFTDRNSGGSSRLTSTLLTAMDDCKMWADLDHQTTNQQDHYQQDRVIVLAATNTPWMIDSALLRPGRFDRIVHVGLPEEAERNAILEPLIKKMKTNLKDKDLVILCGDLARATQGYSGADLAALCRTAAIHSLVNPGEFIVERSHFEQALDEIFPSSSAGLVEKIKHWRPG